MQRRYTWFIAVIAKFEICNVRAYSFIRMSAIKAWILKTSIPSVVVFNLIKPWNLTAILLLLLKKLVIIYIYINFEKSSSSSSQKFIFKFIAARTL